MFSDYIKKDSNFIAPEIRCVKATRNGRESYGDSAIGYVQLKRTHGQCTIIAACCPEQSVRSKSYRVQVEIDLTKSEIKSAVCHDCIASAGGCKHALAVLGWLHRESEKKSVTEVKAYWKKSKLSRVGNTIKFVEAKSLCSRSKKSRFSSTQERKKTPADSFYREVVEWANTVTPQSQNSRSQSSLYYHVSGELSWCDKVDIHVLSLRFRSRHQSTNVFDFLAFSKSYMTTENCKVAEMNTRDQSDNAEWFRLRYEIT